MNIEKQIQVLLFFTKKLDTYKIKYALGGSLLLYFEGIETSVEDIDILIDIQDHNKLLKFLENFNYTIPNSSLAFKTSHFYNIVINDIKFDLMLDFKIQTESNIYSFPFHIEKVIIIKNQKINLSSLTEWLNAYNAMKRIEKIALISHFLNL